MAGAVMGRQSVLAGVLGLVLLCCWAPFAEPQAATAKKPTVVSNSPPPGLLREGRQRALTLGLLGWLGWCLWVCVQTPEAKQASMVDLLTRSQTSVITLDDRTFAVSSSPTTRPHISQA